MDSLNPFQANAALAEPDHLSACFAGATELNEGEYWLLDAPGITGMGSQEAAFAKMSAHSNAGGRLVHRVTKAGTLVEPYDLWPNK